MSLGVVASELKVAGFFFQKESESQNGDCTHCTLLLVFLAALLLLLLLSLACFRSLCSSLMRMILLDVTHSLSLFFFNSLMLQLSENMFS